MVTFYGDYLIFEDQREEFLKNLSVLKHIDILPSARESHFNHTWGKYKVAEFGAPAKRKKK